MAAFDQLIAWQALVPCRTWSDLIGCPHLRQNINNKERLHSRAIPRPSKLQFRARDQILSFDLSSKDHLSSKGHLVPNSSPRTSQIRAGQSQQSPKHIFMTSDLRQLYSKNLAYCFVAVIVVAGHIPAVVRSNSQARLSGLSHP